MESRPDSLPTGTVTFLFSDIEGSTRLAQALGPARWAALLREHDARIDRAVAAVGGVVVKHEGDGAFAAFARPNAALEAAVAIDRSLADLSPDAGGSLPCADRAAHRARRDDRGRVGLRRHRRPLRRTGRGGRQRRPDPALGCRARSARPTAPGRHPDRGRGLSSTARLRHAPPTPSPRRAGYRRRPASAPLVAGPDQSAGSRHDPRRPRGRAGRGRRAARHGQDPDADGSRWDRQDTARHRRGSGRSATDSPMASGSSSSPRCETRSSSPTSIASVLGVHELPGPSDPRDPARPSPRADRCCWSSTISNSSCPRPARSSPTWFATRRGFGCSSRAAKSCGSPANRNIPSLHSTTGTRSSCSCSERGWSARTSH